MRATTYLTVAVLWIGLIHHAQAQTDYRIWCLYMHRFSQHVKWTDQEELKEIVIGVYGISPLIPALEDYFKMKGTSRLTYKIKRISSADQAVGCQILFVTKEHLGDFASLETLLRKEKTLLMSEIPGLAKKGACINFLQNSESELKVEINKKCIEMHGLKISEQALSYGVEVN